MVLDDLDLYIKGQFLKDPDIIFLRKYIQIPVHFPEQTGFVLASGSYKAIKSFLTNRKEISLSITSFTNQTVHTGAGHPPAYSSSAATNLSILSPR